MNIHLIKPPIPFGPPHHIRLFSGLFSGQSVLYPDCHRPARLLGKTSQQGPKISNQHRFLGPIPRMSESNYLGESQECTFQEMPWIAWIGVRGSGPHN